MTPPSSQQLITLVSVLVLLGFAAIATGGIGRSDDCHGNSPKKPCADIEPSDGSTVGGAVTVRATIGTTSVVAGVQFKVDGVNVGPEDTTAPYEAAWDTTLVPNGSHALTATAREADGSVTTARNDVTVDNPTPDTTSPTVQVTSPSGGTTVTGQVTVAASASDNVGVTGVQFKLDGTNLGGEDTAAPFEAAWNSTMSTDGQHGLTAVARDAAGNATTSSVATVTVKNTTSAPVLDTTPPSAQLTSPTGGATVSGQLTVSANASDNTGVASVQFKVDGANLGAADTSAPYSVGWDTTATTNAPHALTRSREMQRGTPPPRLRPPSPSATRPQATRPRRASELTSPAGGATVSGQLTVSANASDNTGVASVQFKLDGANLGAADTSAPYSVGWNTTASTNAQHALTAVARDAAGNTSTSAARSVTVANTASPPPSGSPPPAGGYFSLQPVGASSSLPTGGACSQMVHRSSWEPRPDNYKRNHIVPNPQAVRDFVRGQTPVRRWDLRRPLGLVAAAAR